MIDIPDFKNEEMPSCLVMTHDGIQTFQRWRCKSQDDAESLAFVLHTSCKDDPAFGGRRA